MTHIDPTTPDPRDTEAALEALHAVMHAALGERTQLSESGFSIVFAPAHRRAGRADLSGLPGLARQQLEHAGLPPAPTAHQLAAYRSWRRQTDEARRIREARLIVSRMATGPRNGYLGACYTFNHVRLEDGLGQVLESAAIECGERWEPNVRNHGGFLGAVVSYPDNEAIAATKARFLAAHPELEVRVEDARFA